MLGKSRAAALLLAAVVAAGWAQNRGPSTNTSSILDYIRQTWTVLTRSNGNLGTEVVDPKFKPGPDGKWPLYIPHNANLQSVERALRKDIPASTFNTISVRPLPEDLKTLQVQGLLYLPFPYVVPGGRFNEQYGWDSYFIILGLVSDKHVDLARGMIENFFFQIENYGSILNANRTYYLTRSQPPFLTSMIREVYEHPGSVPLSKAWLAKAYGYAKRAEEFSTVYGGLFVHGVLPG